MPDRQYGYTITPQDDGLDALIQFTSIGGGLAFSMHVGHNVLEQMARDFAEAVEQMRDLRCYTVRAERICEEATSLRPSVAGGGRGGFLQVFGLLVEIAARRSMFKRTSRCAGNACAALPPKFYSRRETKPLK